MRELVVKLIYWLPLPLILLDPFYGIVHYTFSSIIRPEQLMWGATGAAGRIFLMIQVLSFASWLINRGKLTPQDTPLPFQMKLLWFLAFSMSVSTHYSESSAFSWIWTSGFIKMTILCFVISKSMNTTQKLERYYAASLTWSTFLALWGIQQKIGGNPRMEGLGGVQLADVNGLASVYVMYLPMTYYSLFSRNKLIKFFVGIPSLLVFLVFIIYGDSRGAFLGMIACMGIIFWRSTGTQKLKTMAVFILLIMAFFQFAPPEYFDRIATIFQSEDTGEREASAQSRIVFWKTALYVYKTNPQYWFTGVGMFCYARTYPNHYDELRDYLEPEEFNYIHRGENLSGWEVHNTYLDVLLGGGILVFLPWVYLIFYSWRQAHNIPKKYPKIVNGVDIHNYAKAIEVGIVGYCVCIAFLSLTFNDFFYWFLVMAGVVENLARAHVKREASLPEEDEFIEQVRGVSPYSYSR